MKSKKSQSWYTPPVGRRNVEWFSFAFFFWFFISHVALVFVNMDNFDFSVPTYLVPVLLQADAKSWCTSNFHMDVVTSKPVLVSCTGTEQTEWIVNVREFNWSKNRHLALSSQQSGVGMIWVIPTSDSKATARSSGTHLASAATADAHELRMSVEAGARRWETVLTSSPTGSTSRIFTFSLSACCV